MTDFAVPLTLGKHLLQIDTTTFTETPLEVLRSNMAAADWTWDGNNIALTRSVTARTVGEHVRELTTVWLPKGVRSLRSDELAQLAEHSEDWPKGWRIAQGARIFFAGTVYEVRFSSHTEMHVYAARFDEQVNDWLYGCESFDTELLPGDRFASTITDPQNAMIGAKLSWSHSYARRSSCLADDRHHCLRMRYET